MKKYLTAAALLAAGTVFANATTVITLTDLSTSVTEGDITYSSETGYLSGSTLFSSATVSAPTGDTTRYAASTTLVLDLSALGMAAEGSTFSGSGATMLLQYRTGASSTSGAIGLAATQYGLQFTWEGSVWSTTSDTYVSWDTLRGDSYTGKDGSTYVVVTLEGAYRLGGGTSNSGGTQLYNEDGGNFSYATTSGTTGTGYGYSGLASNSVYSCIFVDADYIAALSVFSGAASASEIADVSSVLRASTIPEPSAFGLLAGAGALALVTARRRRSK